MDPVEPWIDAAAVRKLAEQLIAPFAEAEGKRQVDPGFGTQFEGFLPTPQSDELAPPKPAAAEKTEAPTSAITPPETVAAEAFQEISAKPLPKATEAPETRADLALIERLEHFRAWLIELHGARGVFVLDRDGSPVLDDPSYSKLRFLARGLAQSYRPVAGQAGNVHIKVGPDVYLIVLPVDTSSGRLILGAVLDTPPDAAEITVISNKLEVMSNC